MCWFPDGYQLYYDEGIQSVEPEALPLETTTDFLNFSKIFSVLHSESDLSQEALQRTFEGYRELILQKGNVSLSVLVEIFGLCVIYEREDVGLRVRNILKHSKPVDYKCREDVLIHNLLLSKNQEFEEEYLKLGGSDFFSAHFKLLNKADNLEWWRSVLLQMRDHYASTQYDRDFSFYLLEGKFDLGDWIFDLFAHLLLTVRVTSVNNLNQLVQQVANGSVLEDDLDSLLLLLLKGDYIEFASRYVSITNDSIVGVHLIDLLYQKTHNESIREQRDFEICLLSEQLAVNTELWPQIAGYLQICAFYSKETPIFSIFSSKSAKTTVEQYIYGVKRCIKNKKWNDLKDLLESSLSKFDSAVHAKVSSLIAEHYSKIPSLSPETLILLMNGSMNTQLNEKSMEADLLKSLSSSTNIPLFSFNYKL